MMQSKVRLFIERDKLWRVVKRTEICNGETTITSYFYNNCGDLQKEIQEKNGRAMREVNYQYTYDDHFNKTMKSQEFNYTDEFFKELRGRVEPESLNTRSVVYYNNTYECNNLVRKVCFRDDVIYYENRYFFNADKLLRIDRYNNECRLWRTEQYSYQDDTLEITVFLADRTLANYVHCQLSNGVVIGRKIISPTKGKYPWLIWSYNDGSYVIYCGETLLTANMLREIANYIMSIKKVDAALLIIECSDTVVDISDNGICEVERIFMEQGISIQYDP